MPKDREMEEPALETQLGLQSLCWKQGQVHLCREDKSIRRGHRRLGFGVRNPLWDSALSSGVRIEKVSAVSEWGALGGILSKLSERAL